jgi:hypothetical protein
LRERTPWQSNGHRPIHANALSSSPRKWGTTPSDTFEANLDLYAGNAPARRDGWTPAARRRFLEVVAETGIVSRACAWAGLSERSAYNLRNRDPLFAAGWDAACLLARDPLADGLREQAAEGITETITRGGEVIAIRHRFDSRLSMAVLHRLDKRCDRAAELGGPHLALVRHWDKWLTLVGNGEEQAALALLRSDESASHENARHHELRELPERENPAADIPNPPGMEDWKRCWRDQEGRWLTDFPPPPGFDGYESREWDGFNAYERACTAAEAALLDADEVADQAEQDAEEVRERAENDQAREAWFAALRTNAASGLGSHKSTTLMGSLDPASSSPSTASE